jgi:uncharacterized membrane protein
MPMRYLVAYAAAALVMVGLDLIWLSRMGDTLYRSVLGEIMTPDPDMKAAVAFYLIYVLGVLWFAVRPALNDGDWRTALLNGALFGFFAYATYDLTNMATLKVWALRITLADMAWGTVLTGAAATAGALAGRLVGRA